MRRDEYLKIKNGFRKNGPATSKSLELHLLRYAVNLLGKVAFTNESLSFFFSVIPPNTLKQIQNSIAAELSIPDQPSNRFGGDSINTLIERITELPLECPPSRYRSYEQFVISTIEKEYHRIQKKELYPKRLEHLAEQFDLTDTEIEIILFFLVIIQSEPLSDLYDQFEGGKELRFISLAIGKSELKVTRALTAEAKLVRMQFIEATNSPRRRGSQKNFELTETIVNYIHGLDSTSFRREIYTETKGKTFPLEGFLIKQDELSVIRSLLESNNPVNILFYGKPGTGKTELAKAICKTAEKKAYFLKPNNLIQGRRPHHAGPASGRVLLLQIALNVLEDNGGVLIVDEADEILNTKNPLSMMFGNSAGGEKDKGFLNSVLDEHTKKIIWITNSIQGVEGSVLRRFSYSRNFIKTTVGQRKIYWKSLVKKYKVAARIGPKAIEELAAGYPINAGHISKALETFASLPAGKGDIGFLKEILDKQSELLGRGNTGKTSETSVKPQFDIQFINTDVPVQQVVHSIKSKYGSSTEDSGRRSSEQTGAHLLLHGAPGTGKTEFARYIAAELDKGLILKRSSDILSKWVGENEQNIRDAFAEAEAESAVLCIDEADSFFRNRESARSSWEVSFTNELLTQMEHFSGVFVCSTNLIDILDPAVMRRFAWKVKFLPLRKEHRTEIIQAYFQFPELTETDRRTFAGITDLTPGDVKAVWLKYGTSPSLSPAEIAEELKRETGYRQIGSGEIGFRECT